MKKKTSISLSREEIIALLASLEVNLMNETGRDDEDLDETYINELAMLKRKLENKL